MRELGLFSLFDGDSWPVGFGSISVMRCVASSVKESTTDYKRMS